MRILALALVVPLAACTLQFSDDDQPPPGDDDGDDAPPVDPPEPPPTAPARLVIGSQPSVVATHEDWAQLWINYPGYDCEAINRYGADLAVVIDPALEAFIAATPPAVPGPFADGWLSLERTGADQLWRVTAWTPAPATQPACYHW